MNNNEVKNNNNTNNNNNNNNVNNNNNNVNNNNNNTTTTNATSSNSNSLHINTKSIREIVDSVSPGERMDSEVEALLVEIANDFVDDVALWACRLAKHREAKTVEVKDVQLHLQRNWNMTIPGYSEALSKDRFKRPSKNLSVHLSRVNAIKKEQKNLALKNRSASTRKTSKKRKRN